MKHKLFSLAAAWLLMLLAMPAHAQGIQFVQGSFDDAMAEARKANRPLFVDIWATWCGPCKRLGREIFPQQKVGDYFNPRFVCYQLQTDPKDTVALRRAREVMEQYQVTALPTLLWIAPNGELMHYCTGFCSADELISRAQTALDPEKRVGTALAKWQQGDRSLKVGYQYFAANSTKQDEADKWYLALSPEEQCDSDMCMFLTFTVPLSPTSAIVKHVAANWDSQYKDLNDADSWRLLVYNKVIDDVQRAERDAQADSIINSWKAYPQTFIDEACQMGNVLRLLALPDFAKANDAITRLHDAYGSKCMRRILFSYTELTQAGKMTPADAHPQLKEWTLDYLKGLEQKPQGEDPTGKNYHAFSAALTGLQLSVVLADKAEAQRYAKAAKDALSDDATKQFIDGILNVLK